MPVVERVLDPEPIANLASYVEAGGGAGLLTARKLGLAAVIEEVEASGLRGRGGAGFPTGAKWRTVATNAAPELPSVVAVNGAEGEPGSFKDRMLLRRNPYRVIEGALIAALAVYADLVVVAIKASFQHERERVLLALAEIEQAGWTSGVTLRCVTGPDAYLFGEETALLEVIDNRHPFPRIAPPYRHGVDEVGTDTGETADLVLAAPGDATPAPPTLANNVETMANIPRILADGPTWFRTVGTDRSPGTIVCTVTGDVQREGVAEMALGSPLAEIVEHIGSGTRPGTSASVALSGVANPLIPASLFDTPATYEHLAGMGSALGAAGFIVFDDSTDPIAIAAGVARFLSIESCGQCTPCKLDGLMLADHFDRLRRGDGGEQDVTAIESGLRTVADGARCNLALQQQLVLGSILRLFPDAVRSRARLDSEGVGAVLIAPIRQLDEDKGVAVLDDRHLLKNPDWTIGGSDSGKAPVERLGHAMD